MRHGLSVEALKEDSVSGVVVSASVGPNVAAPARSITYTVSVRTAQGATRAISIGRPEFEMWPADGPWVFPLPIGHRIYGRRFSTGAMEPARYTWQYVETPRMRLCSP